MINRSLHCPRLARTLLILALGFAPLAAVAAAGSTSASDSVLQWWITNAEAGKADYQYHLGGLYETGAPELNLAPDPARALYWYQRAATQGDAAATAAVARLQQRTTTETAAAPSATSETIAPAPRNPVARYWSWWQGGIALGVIVLGYWLAFGMPLGVSSSWERIVGWRAYRRAEAADRALAARDAGAVTDALLAETLRQFGPTALAQLKAGIPSKPQPLSTATTNPPLPWTAHITFLMSLVFGGFVAAILTDTFTPKLTLDEAFTRSAGDDWATGALLVLGGVLVGFGTRMAGGCSSGHGLTGCARLQPGSLLATASFFGSATLLTLLLVKL